MSPATTPSSSSPDHAADARLYTTLLAGIVRRAERNILTGRNRSATVDTVEQHVTHAMRAILAIEDRDGVDAATSLSDRFDRIRRRAITVGLLTPGQYNRIEQEVCGDPPPERPLDELAAIVNASCHHPVVTTTPERARREAIADGADPALADEIEALMAEQCDDLGCS